MCNLKQCSLAQGSQPTAPAALARAHSWRIPKMTSRYQQDLLHCPPLLCLLSLHAMQALRSDRHLLQALCPPPFLVDPQAAFCAKHR